MQILAVFNGSWMTFKICHSRSAGISRYEAQTKWKNRSRCVFLCWQCTSLFIRRQQCWDSLFWWCYSTTPALVCSLGRLIRSLDSPLCCVVSGNSMKSHRILWCPAGSPTNHAAFEWCNRLLDLKTEKDLLCRLVSLAIRNSSFWTMC